VAATVGAVLAFAALPVASALADTTVGQAAPPTLAASWVGGDEIVDTAYVVPAGGGTITSFHTYSSTCQTLFSGFAKGTYDFQVLRPQPPSVDQYVVVGHTGNHTDPCDSTLHSFSVNIPVQAGDVLGVYVVSRWVGFLSTSDGFFSGGQVFQFQPQPTVGQTVTVAFPDAANKALDESATLLTQNDNSGGNNNNQGQNRHH
jgi:hypothetical protein